MAMTTTSTRGGRQRWRLIGWGGAACLLLLPLLAMRFSDEVNWTGFDFLAFATLLLVSGGLFELALRVSGHRAYRAATALALAAALLLVWANAAVGIIGSEDNPTNRLFDGVLALGLVGALIARLRAAGMVWVMRAMALAQLAVGAVVGFAGAGQVVLLTALYVAIWLGAAWLFGKAAAS